jgi:hypothetical protein
VRRRSITAAATAIDGMSSVGRNVAGIPGGAGQWSVDDLG